MIPASATSVVGPVIVVPAFSTVAVSSASCLTSGNIRICRTSSTRDGNVLRFLVLYHGRSRSADNWMYALLRLTDKTSSAIDDVALLDGIFVSVSISYSVVIMICSLRRSFVIVFYLLL